MGSLGTLKESRTIQNGLWFQEHVFILNVLERMKAVLKNAFK